MVTKSTIILLKVAKKKNQSHSGLGNLAGAGAGCSKNGKQKLKKKNKKRGWGKRNERMFPLACDKRSAACTVERCFWSGFLAVAHFLWIQQENYFRINILDFMILLKEMHIFYEYI